MTKDIFSDREKALEENYFRQQDAKLLEKLRQNAALDEIAIALAEKLQVENPEILVRAREVGITQETAAAFLLAPLVEVGWAEGSVGKQERDTVLRLARERGVEVESPAYAQLVTWLEHRPSDELFDAALDVLRSGFAVMPHKEKEERINRVVDACHQVAAASRSGVSKLTGLGDGVSASEALVLDAISDKLRGRS